MRLPEIAEKLKLKDLTPGQPADPELDVVRGYASDLLSDVLSNAPSGGVLVTVQVHMNVVAVAVHAGLAAVIFSGNRAPEAEVRAKAEEEKVKLYAARESTFDVAGRLYELGVRGGRA